MGERSAATEPALSSSELALPQRRELALLGIAVLAVSTSGPLIAATVAPALAIAFWRNALATAATLPLAVGKGLTTLPWRAWRPTVLAGFLLAAHFATWMIGVKTTTVAAATALTATQPIWSALFARIRGVRITPAAWWGIGLAVAATAVLTGLDVRVSGRAALGDVLALVAGVFAAGYVTAGARARRYAATTVYTAGCYGTTSIVLAGLMAAAGVSYTGFPAADWGRIVALTGGAQLLGHSLFNHVLRTTSPTVVSLAILFEVPGAAVLAALFLHQRIELFQIPAFAVLIGALALVIRAGGRAVPAE